MAFSDLIYFSPDASFRVAVEVQTDGGAYLDLNARVARTDKDYWAGLRSDPRISFALEKSTRTYSAQVSSITMDNRPWRGTGIGFWDTLLPITNLGGTNTISAWYRRKIRIRVVTYDANGAIASTITRFTGYIDGVETGSGNTATIKIAPLHKIMMERSAASIKHGGESYRSAPIGALINILVKQTTPDVVVGASISNSLIDYGTMDEFVASSWGSAPGWMSDGTPSINQWIPRCFGGDASVSSDLWVGFEVPNTNLTSGGGIAKFNAATGRWSILCFPQTAVGGNYWFSSYHVEAIWGSSDGYVYACLARPKDPINHSGFFEMMIVRIYKTDVSIGNQLAVDYGWWPCRYTLRNGGLIGATRYIGYIWSYSQWFSEPFFAPFNQQIDLLYPEIFYTSEENHYFDYYNERHSSTTRDAWSALTDKHCNAVRPGAYSIVPNTSATADAARMFLNPANHPPQIAGYSTYKYWYWLGTSGTEWKFSRLRIRPTLGSTEIWGMVNMRDSLTDANEAVNPQGHIYQRSITAWTFRPNISDSTIKALFAVTEWKHTTDGAAIYPYSRTVLWEGTFVSGQSEGTFTKLWDSVPVSASTLPMYTIVALDSPPQSYTDPTGLGPYILGVCFNRRYTGGAPYTLCVYSTTDSRWLSLDDEATATIAYDGPRSSMPFGAFCSKSNDEEDDYKQIFTAMDQATGQIWEICIDFANAQVTYRMGNDAMPVYEPEKRAACFAGARLRFNDAEGVMHSRLFFSTAPEFHGDVRDQNKYTYQRASQQLAVPGSYPMIQYSKKVADAIDSADFEELTAWGGVELLTQASVYYNLYETSTGVLNMARRTAGTPVATLAPLCDVGVADIVNDQIPVESWSKVTGWSEVINACDIVPYSLQPSGDVEVTTVKGSGSLFAGTYLYNVRTERPLRIRIQCTHCGDMKQNPEGARLFSWVRIMESLHSYLATAAAFSDTTIWVGGFKTMASYGLPASAGPLGNENRYYMGDQEITPGDFVRVGDGYLRKIVSFSSSPTSPSSISILLDGQIGAATEFSAPQWSEVEVIPKSGEMASDAGSGITNLDGPLNPPGGTLTFTVLSAANIAPGMVVGIKDELMKVTEVSGRSVVVAARNAFGSKHTGIAASGTPVRAYVHLAKAGVLYLVGGTGVEFGLDVNTEDEADPADQQVRLGERTIVVGDGVILSQPGYRLKEIKQAVIREVKSQSIEEIKRSEPKDRNNQPIKNRFLDFTRGRLFARESIAVDGSAKIRYPVARMRYWPGVNLGDTLTIKQGRMAPTDLAVQVVGIDYDFNRKKPMQSMTLRAFATVEGTGKVGPTDKRIRATMRGRRGR